MTIIFELVIKPKNQYIANVLDEYGYIHNGKINDFDFDKTLNDCIDEAKRYHKTEYVQLSQIIIR